MIMNWISQKQVENAQKIKTSRQRTSEQINFSVTICKRAIDAMPMKILLEERSGATSESGNIYVFGQEFIA